MSIFDMLRIKTNLHGHWEKYYSKEELNIHIPNVSMYNQVLISSHKYPNNKAIEYLGINITYKKLIKKIDACAVSFKALGIKKGDIVTLCLPNIPEVLICLYALNKIGAIANMTHPLSAEEEIKDTLNSTKSKILVMADMFYNKIENIINETTTEKVIFVSPADSFNPVERTVYNILQKNKFKHHPKDDRYLSYKKFYRLSWFYDYDIKEKYGKNTPAVILHSGGTTGKPKNVVIQNRAFILGAKQESIALKELVPGDCCLAIMPNFHGFGLSVCMHTPLALGCYTILIPKFNAKKFDTLFKKTKPTCVLGVPTLFEALIHNKNEDNLDLSNLKYVISGGDVLPENLEMEINDYLHEHGSLANVTQGYGLSEVLAAVSLGVGRISKSGSIGIPLAGNYIKIINPSTRQELEPNQIGEIVINSKALMLGYLNDEAETNAALQIHDDGHIWLHTGDLGIMDEQGFLYYKGRQKRMIISSGYNVYPSHIEEVIESHYAVLQCSVVGIPHPYKQEVCKAFIVLKPGYHALLVSQDIKNYCASHLAHYMVPVEFVYRRQLPRTKLGKVDFQKLQSDLGEDDSE